MSSEPTDLRHPRPPRARRALLVALCAVGLLLAGCGSSATTTSRTSGGGTSGGGTTAKPAYCQQLTALKSSVNDLAKVNVARDGTGALRRALDRVRANATATIDAIRGHFSAETAPLKRSLNALSQTVKGIAQSPTAAQLGQLPAQLSAVSTDAAALVKSASPKCS